MQPAFPAASHDSLQYHFFADGTLFATRIFRTETLEHHSTCVFDGTSAHDFNNTAERVQQRGDELNIASDSFEVALDGKKGHVGTGGSTPDACFTVDYDVVHSISQRDPGSVGNNEGVIHQPGLAGTILYKGQKLTGVGYCKRYFWQYPPRWWGCCFAQGFDDSRQEMFWSAESVYAKTKYNYFKLIGPGGLSEAKPDDTSHKQNGIVTQLDGERVDLELERLATWETVLTSPGMESLMLQGYSRMTIRRGGKTVTGVAFNEHVFGTLGQA